jgi:hypothetical protein
LHVRLVPSGGKRVHDRRGIVSLDDAAADHRHRHHAEAERNQLVVRRVVFLDVFHGKVGTLL